MQLSKMPKSWRSSDFCCKFKEILSMVSNGYQWCSCDSVWRFPISLLSESLIRTFDAPVIGHIKLIIVISNSVIGSLWHDLSSRWNLRPTLEPSDADFQRNNYRRQCIIFEAIRDEQCATDSKVEHTSPTESWNMVREFRSTVHSRIWKISRRYIPYRPLNRDQRFLEWAHPPTHNPYMDEMRAGIFVLPSPSQHIACIAISEFVLLTCRICHILFALARYSF